jgi:hypothetical protein
MLNMVWWYRLGLTPNSSTRVFWQPPVQSAGPVSRYISGASRMGQGNKNLVYPSPWDFKRSLTCRKILRHGTSGFTSIRRKACCGFLSPLKIHRLGRVWTPTFVSSGKHTNHYNTNATYERTVRFTLSLLHFRWVRFGRLCVRRCVSSSRGGKEENPFSALSLAIVLNYYFICFGFNPSPVKSFLSLKNRVSKDESPFVFQ